jgi:branched-chain amino acid transport system substrate-binding protein
MVRYWLSLLAAAVFTSASAVAAQEIKIGFTGTFTGPNASNGIPYRNATELFPKTLGGVPVKWIVLDDGGDATNAMKNARRFVDVDKVDAIVGSTSTPTAMTLFDIANETSTAQFAMSPVGIPKDKQAFVYNMVQPVPLMLSAVMEDMKAKGVKTLAFIGYADGWGDLNWNVLQPMAKKAGIEIVAHERYNRTDPSVTAQALKIVAAAPDAVYIGAATTPAVLPHVTLKDMGYEGQIYQTHGTVAQAFINSGGKAVEGARMPTGPMVVAADLPEDNPIKGVSVDFIKKYQARWGDGPVPPFAGYAWDAMLLLDAASAKALKTAKPGTHEFRVALRDAVDSGIEVVGTNAVYKYGPNDHYGVDERARVLVEVRDGKFRLVK